MSFSDLCESVSRVFESLGELLPRNNLARSISFVSVEVGDAADSDNINIPSVPSLRWFDGTSTSGTVYQGELHPAALISWIQRLIGGAHPVYISNIDDIQNLAFPWLVFGCIMESDAEGMADFFRISSIISDMGFAYSTQPSTCSALNITSNLSLVSICNKRDMAFECTASVPLTFPETILSSIYRLRIPHVLDVSSDPLAVQALLNSRSPFFILAHSHDLDGTTNLVDLGQQARNLQASFVVVDSREAVRHKIIHRFVSLIGIGVGPTSSCEFWYIDPIDGDFHRGGMQRYYSNDCTTPLRDMLKLIREGGKGEYMRISNSSDTTGLQVKNIKGGQDFLSLITSSEYSLVLHYVPWCEKCYHIMKEVEEIAIRDDPGILVGAIDCSTNDVPVSLRVTKYPTLVLYHSSHVGNLANTTTYDRKSGDVESWLRGIVTEP